MMIVSVRKAVIEDMLSLYLWRNDEQVRLISFNKASIDYDTHAHWFSASLKNSNRYIYIVLANEKSVGYVRFEVDKQVAKVSIVVDPSQMGKGYGTQGLLLAIQTFKKELPDCTELNAAIFPDNMGSKKIFNKAGFILSHCVYKLGE